MVYITARLSTTVSATVCKNSLRIAVQRALSSTLITSYSTVITASHCSAYALLSIDSYWSQLRFFNAADRLSKRRFFAWYFY
jgi:hypothetical protein